MKLYDSHDPQWLDRRASASEPGVAGLSIYEVAPFMIFSRPPVQQDVPPVEETVPPVGQTVPPVGQTVPPSRANSSAIPALACFAIREYAMSYDLKEVIYRSESCTQRLFFQAMSKLAQFQREKDYLSCRSRPYVESTACAKKDGRGFRLLIFRNDEDIHSGT
ncbi:hypothetical protein AVEN_89113-1 [Araneus ventricosus]|uniref:Uncharacterized protein n=1 Tax=Araneus ventricosus TaxID=182803 RepID=A0A4Y2B445_ARAVE|nr:hypothetical protein AVEN_89113-1 [Araneus ventricosus]